MVQVLARNVKCGSSRSFPGAGGQLLAPTCPSHRDGAQQQNFHILQSHKFYLVPAFCCFWSKFHFQSWDKWSERNLHSKWGEEDNKFDSDWPVARGQQLRPTVTLTTRWDHSAVLVVNNYYLLLWRSSTVRLFPECRDVVCKHNQRHPVQWQHHSSRLSDQWNY